MINTVLEHVPIKMENFNDDECSNLTDSSIVWRASTSTDAAPAATISSRTSSMTTRNLEVDDVIESCGNIFLYCRRKLFLVCGFCDSKYANMLQFAKHLNDCHKIFYTRYEETSNQDANAAGTDDSDSDATTTASSSSTPAGLIVKGGFQIRFVGEGSTIAANDEESLPTPSDVLLRHVPIKVEQDLEDKKDKSDFENNIESCGNIFVMNRRKLFLICGFCEGKYANMELFGTHLHEFHKIFEDEKELSHIVIPTVMEIKEEPEEVLVTVKRRPTTNENSLPMVAIPTSGNENIIPPEDTEAANTAPSKTKRLLRESRNELESSKDTNDCSNEIPTNEQAYFDRSSIHTNYSCRKCLKQFKKLCRMLEHVRIHTGEKPYECPECGKRFRVKLRLTEHQMRHRKVKAFICQICGLGCATSQDFGLHQRHHKGDKRYSCKECGKAFVRSGDLKTHMRIHTDERPFKCEICNITFRANQNLIIHRRKHEPNKEFKCEYCEKRFRRNIDRKVHHRTHTGEKAFRCEICNRGYSAKVHVRRHIQQTHMNLNQSGEQLFREQSQEENNPDIVNKTSKKNKSFKCAICPKGYSSKYTLEKHMKKVHDNEATNKDDHDQATKSIDDISSQVAANCLGILQAA